MFRDKQIYISIEIVCLYIYTVYKDASIYTHVQYIYTYIYFLGGGMHTLPVTVANEGV